MEERLLAALPAGPWQPASHSSLQPRVQGGATAYVASSVAAMFAALVGIYLFTPYDFAWHLGTSTSRVVLPLGLFAAAFAPIALASVLGRGSDDPFP